MGTRITGGGAEKVYAAAGKWVERALRADDSLFTPGKAIWSRRWLGELHERFLNHPDESSDSFLEKLQQQLADSPPGVYQLMGEVLYFYFLIVTTRNSANEQLAIDTVLGWSPSPAEIPQELVASLTPGIASPGQYFHTSRPFQVGFLIEFVEQWKEYRPDEQRLLLADPWEFHTFCSAKQLKGTRRIYLDGANRVKLEPDLTWWQSGACLFVGDAKYKKIEVQHAPNTDLYQMLAYTTALDLPGGMLIYAEGEAKPVVHEVRHSRKRLEIAALDLSGTLEEVLNRVLDLAVRVKVLRDEAKALRPAA